MLSRLIYALTREWSRSSQKAPPLADDIRSEFTIKVRRDPSSGVLSVDLPDEDPPIVLRRDDFDIHFDIKGRQIEMTVGHP